MFGITGISKAEAIIVHNHKVHQKSCLYQVVLWGGGSLEPLRLEKGASGRESLELSFQGLRTLPMAPRTEECRAAPGTRAVSARVALKRGGKSTTSLKKCYQA